jgi:hypothetical protein
VGFVVLGIEVGIIGAGIVEVSKGAAVIVLLGRTKSGDGDIVGTEFSKLEQETKNNVIKVTISDL